MMGKLPLPADDLTEILRLTEPLWPELRGARLLFTGGTGFFGRWMLESLLAANETYGLGISATVISRDPTAFLHRAPPLLASEIDWVQASIATLAPDFLSQSRFDAVVHLATEADSAATVARPLAAIEAICQGTERILEVARRTGARRFLFASSGSVYGPQPHGLDFISEDFLGAPDPTNLADAYAISGQAKRHAELLCAASASQHGLGAVIARGFTFAGPGLPLAGKFAFGNFLRNALAGETIVLSGDGTPVRSYLHAIDLTVWLWTMLARGRPGRAYNLGSERPVSLRELAETVARELEAPGVKVLGVSPPGRAPHRYVPATKRAREELGLVETISLAEGIQRTARWHRDVLKS